MIAIVTTTVARRADAGRLAAALVGERLAACVQVEAVASCYRWAGRVEHAEEWRVQAKTTPALAARTAARIAELHGYDLPEIVTIVAEASPEYAAWVEGETACF